jgi:anti-anti-sigma factor
MSADPTHGLLEVEHFGARTVGRFVRRTILESAAIEAVGTRLHALVRDEGRRLLVLNFARVESVTSGLFGTFVALQKEVEAGGGRLVFCNVDTFLAEIFRICQLPTQITVYPDEAEALRSLEAPPA